MHDGSAEEQALMRSRARQIHTNLPTIQDDPVFPFDTLDPAGGKWIPGTATSYSPPSVIDLGVGAYALVSPPALGVILYQVIDFKEIIGAIGLYVTSRIYLQLGISGLLDVSLVLG
jgi:hypothetical protein